MNFVRRFFTLGTPRLRFGVLFLDIDGVLNSEESRQGGDHAPAQDLLDNLAEIVRATGVHIVLSSTWRLQDDSHRAVELALASCGLSLFSSTADYAEQCIGDRVDEILGWIAGHPEYDITSWIAVDDMDLRRMNARLDASHFVQTCDSVGLTTEKVQEAIEKLCAQQHAAV